MTRTYDEEYMYAYEEVDQLMEDIYSCIQTHLQLLVCKHAHNKGMKRAGEEGSCMREGEKGRERQYQFLHYCTLSLQADSTI